MRKASEITTVEEFIQEIYTRHEELTRGIYRNHRIGQVAMNLAAEFSNNLDSELYSKLLQGQADIYYIKDIALPDSPTFEKFLEISRRFFQNQKAETSSVDEPAAVEELPEPLEENQIGSPIEVPLIVTQESIFTRDIIDRLSRTQIWEAPIFPSVMSHVSSFGDAVAHSTNALGSLRNAMANTDAVDAAALAQIAIPQTHLMSVEEFQQLNNEWAAIQNPVGGEIVLPETPSVEPTRRSALIALEAAELIRNWDIVEQEEPEIPF